jgi:hypothetical protein
MVKPPIEFKFNRKTSEFSNRKYLKNNCLIRVSNLSSIITDFLILELNIDLEKDQSFLLSIKGDLDKKIFEYRNEIFIENYQDPQIIGNLSQLTLYRIFKKDKCTNYVVEFPVITYVRHKHSIVNDEVTFVTSILQLIIHKDNNSTPYIRHINIC